jgi:hypothetical protein
MPQLAHGRWSAVFDIILPRSAEGNVTPVIENNNTHLM